MEVMKTILACKLRRKNVTFHVEKSDVSLITVTCYDLLTAIQDETYLLLTEFEGRTVSYGPSFFLLDLWPKREALGP